MFQGKALPGQGKTKIQEKKKDNRQYNIINPEYSEEGLMLKLKLQYFGHLMRRADSLEKIVILRKIEGRRRRG